MGSMCDQYVGIQINVYAVMESGTGRIVQSINWKIWELMLAKYLARAVKGDDLRSPACSAWVRIPQILFFLLII